MGYACTFERCPGRHSNKWEVCSVPAPAMTGAPLCQCGKRWDSEVHERDHDYKPSPAPSASAGAKCECGHAAGWHYCRGECHAPDCRCKEYSAPVPSTAPISGANAPESGAADGACANPECEEGMVPDETACWKPCPDCAQLALSTPPLNTLEAARRNNLDDTSYPPTSAEINSLPPNLRRWIAELETDADPAGTIRKAALVGEENSQLRALVAEQKTGNAMLVKALGECEESGVTTCLWPQCGCEEKLRCQRGLR